MSIDSRMQLGRCLSGRIRKISPRNFTRWIEGIESLWIPDVTAGVQLTPHPTLCARSMVLQYPHPAPGKSWRAGVWGLEPLRCGTWRGESKMSAICGRACEDGEDRLSVHYRNCAKSSV